MPPSQQERPDYTSTLEGSSKPSDYYALEGQNPKGFRRLTTAYRSHATFLTVLVVLLLVVGGVGGWMLDGRTQSGQAPNTDSNQPVGGSLRVILPIKGQLLTINSTLKVNNNTSVTGNLGVSGIATLQRLTVAGATQLQGNLTVAGSGTFSGTVTASNIRAASYSGNGSGLTGVNADNLAGQPASFYQDASNLGSGTVSDDRLAADVALTDRINTFTDANTFESGLAVQGTLGGQAASFSGNVSAASFTQNGYAVCDTSGNCGSGGGGGVTGTGTAGTLAMFASAAGITDSIVTQSGTTVTVAGTLSATALQGDGSALTSVNAVTLNSEPASFYQNASNLTAGTVSDARLSTDVALLDAAANVFTGSLTANSLSGNGSGITNVNAAELGGQSSSYYTNASNIASGTLSLAYGGTGSGTSSFTTGGIVYSNGSALVSTVAGTTGECLVADTGSAPVWQSCSSAAGGSTPGGAAGGDLSGDYPDPTVSGLDNTPLSIATLTAGDVLQYNGTDWVNGLVSNTDLSSGSYNNITGTGNLTSGSIGSGFGSILTTDAIQGSNLVATGSITSGTASAAGSLILQDGSGNPVTITTATRSSALTLLIPDNATGSDTFCLVTLANCSGANGGAGNGNYIENQLTQQADANFNIDGTGEAAKFNATDSFELNGVDITTGGTLSNFAYLDQDNAFTGDNTFSATGSTALAATGAPASSATSSLIQIGAALQGGNTDGTYLSINEPSSGAGSAADFLNFENGNTNVLTVDSGGYLTAAAGLQTNGYIEGNDFLGFNGVYGIINENNTGDPLIFQTNGGSISVKNNGYGGIDVNDDGTADVWDNTDSATAFQIQNANGDSVLNLDTASNVLTLGNVTASSGDTAAGILQLADGTDDGYGLTLQTASLNGNVTLTIPAEASGTSSDTVCLKTLGNCTGANGGSGDDNYIENQLTQQANANFNIDGSGTIGSDLTVNGAATLKDSTDSATAFQIQNTDGDDLLAADTTDQRIDIGTGGTPTAQLYVSGSLPTAPVSTIQVLNDENFTAQGNYVYACGNPDAIADVANPADPDWLVGYAHPFANCGNIAVAGNYAYVTAGDSLQVVNIANPANAVPVGNVAVPGSNAVGIAVAGNYVYVTDYSGSSELEVFDVSSPTNPVNVGSLALDQTTGAYTNNNITIHGNYAYITSDVTSSVQIVNISNPASPTLVSTITGNLNSPEAVAVDDQYAYVTNYATSGNYSDTIAIFDISNPASPSFVASIGTGSGSAPIGLTVQGRYVYVADSGTNAIGVFDVSNPVSPQAVGTIATGSSTTPNNVAVNGNYLYENNYNGNDFEIFDLGGTYTQSLQAGSTETGTLQVDTSANISGAETIGGSLSVAQSIQDAGSLSVGGAAYLSSGATITGATAVEASNVTLAALSTPTAPTVTPEGTTGSTSYSYEVVAVSSNGGTTLASPSGNTTSGNATLSSSNYNQISWIPVTGAVSYDIYRTASGGTPSSTGLIGTSTTTLFNDTGLTASGSAPTTNTAQSNLIDDGTATFQNTTNSATAFQVQDSSGADLLEADSINGQVTVSNLIVSGDAAFTAGSDYSVPGTTNNVDFGSGSLFRLTGASAQTITGIAGGTNGRMITLINEAAQAATLKNDDTADSSAANLIITGTGHDLTIASGASVSLIYDSESSVWRVMGTISGSESGGSYVSLQTSTPTTPDTGGFNVSGSGTIGGGLTVSNSTSGSPAVQASSDDSLQNSPTATIQNEGTGDATLALSASGNNYFLGVDTANGGALSIGSSYAANGNGTNIGVTTVGSDPGEPLAGYINAQSVTTTAAGQADSISVYITQVDPTNPDGMVAIYADNAGQPGSLVATSSSQALTMGWNTLPLSGSLSAGTTYWIAIQFNGDATEYITTNSGTHSYMDSTFGTFPGNASWTGGAGGVLSMYLTYGPVAQIVGNTTVEPDAFNNSGNILTEKITPSSNGTSQSISVYVSSVDPDNPDMQVAIYSDNAGPSGGTLLASSASQAVTAGWNTFPISTPISGGTSYWIGFQQDGNTDTVWDNCNGASTTTGWASNTYGSFPSTFPSGTGCGIFSLYLTYGNGGGTINDYNNALFTINASGQTTLKNATNSAAAFQIQDASGTDLLDADTTDDTIKIGATGTPTGQLYVSGTIPSTDVGTLSAPSGYEYETADGTNRMLTQGEYEYMVVENQSTNETYLETIDISQPSDPTEVGLTDLGFTGWTGMTQLAGQYVYIQNGGWVMIVSIQNPGKPVVVNNMYIYGAEFSVAGNYMYTADAGAFTVYDIANPADPTVEGATAITDGDVTGVGQGPQEVLTSGSYAYVDYFNADRLLIYNVANPASPQLMSATSPPDAKPNNMAISGNTLYIESYDAGRVMSVNVADPTNPAYVSDVLDDTSGAPISVAGQRIYIATGDIEEFDVSDPANMYQLGAFGDSSGDLGDATYSGRYAYAVSTSTFYVYDLGGTVTQTLQAGSAETDALQVNQSASIGGSLTVQGGISASSINGGTVGTNSLMVDQAPNAAAPVLLGVSEVDFNHQDSGDNNGMVGDQFTTGSSSETVSYLNVYIGATDTYPNNEFQMALYSDSSNAPGSLIVNSPISQLTPNSWNSVAIPTTTLTANTSYWIMSNTNGTQAGLDQPYFSDETINYIDGAAQAFGTYPSTFPSSSPGPYNAWAMFASASSSNGNATIMQIQNASGQSMEAANVQLNSIGFNQLTAPDTAYGPNVVATPDEPTVGTSGTAGTTSYSYEVAAVNCFGIVGEGSPVAMVSTGNATLNGTNYNTISWSAPNSNCVNGYNVYRTASGGSPGSTGLIASVGSGTTSYDDQGAAATYTTIPGTANNLSASTEYYYEVTALDAAGGETTTSAEANATTGASGKAISIAWDAVPGARGYNVYRSTASGNEELLATTTKLYYIDTGSVDTTDQLPPILGTAYTSELGGQNSRLSVGTIGTTQGQLYVSGTLPDLINSTAIDSGSASARGIATEGSYAYVADQNGYLDVYNVAVPSSPALLASVATDGGAQYVAVSGNYAYVTTNSSDALQVFNVANPSAPVSVGSVATSGATPVGISIEGRYAYIAAQDGLEVFDVANPTAPVEISHNSTNADDPYGIAVQGNYAYIANVNGSMAVYDIVDPANPTAVTSVSTGGSGGYFSLVTISGSYAYVSNYSQHTIYTFDISNPTTPSLMSEIDTDSNDGPEGLSVQGNRLYAVDGSASLEELDITDPANPVIIGQVANQNNETARALAIIGRYGFETTRTPGYLNVYDLGGSYTQQLQAGGTETGTLQVDQGAAVGGDVNVSDGLTVGGGTDLQGGLGVSGAATFQNATDSTSAFQVKDVAGDMLLGVDTQDTAVTIGDTADAVTQTVSVGDNATAGSTSTVNVGSATDGSSTTVQGGGNSLALLTGSSANSTGSIIIQSGNSSGGVAGSVNIDTGTGPGSVDNLILDDTFEGSTDDMDYWLGTENPLVTSSAEAHGGSSSLEINVNSSYWGILEDNAGAAFAVVPGHSYQASLWAMSAAANSDIIRLNLIFRDSQGNPLADYLIKTSGDSSSGWTQLTGSAVTAPAGAAAAYVQIGSNGNGAVGEVQYLDDLTVTDVTGDAGPAINVGTGNANSINIGNANQTSATTITGGSGGVSLQASGVDQTLADNTDLVQSTANSTAAFQVQDAGGDTVLGVDTSNDRVGIGTTSPGNLLSVGSLTTAAGTFQIAVSTGGATSSGIVVQTVAGQSGGDILQAQNSTGAILASIDYQGNLSVQSATVNGTLTLNGHLVTGNASAGTTAAAAQTPAGTGATCAVTGDDTSGQIVLTTGTAGWSTGAQCIITFASSYGSNTPHPVIAPASDVDASGLKPYVTATSTTFTLNFTTAASSQATYTWNYFNAQ